uniref:NADH-ubiquinone oxidoreductase chain 5 n=1 Tax=Vagitanus terminalis TaxID=2170276 RepID=A0A344AM15_9HEMI|nr:NADH dehydrogenase subunit 5 [Vagitanus terminalis]
MSKLNLNNYFFSLLIIFSTLNMYLSLYLIINDLSIMVEFLILKMNSCSIFMTIIFDFMSTLFLSTVSFISGIVMLYSKDYMSNDKSINRFSYIVMMFVLSMILLIISPNMISIIIGWDGLGLVSYCLVIYYQNTSSNNSGMLTALMNRVGDVSILICIAWMLNFGSWNFYSHLDKMTMNYVMLLVVIASFTSSAQIPFSSWLPAAMAAPTPVSALVHSSTLVTAGVYLMIRFSNLLMNYNMNMFLTLSLLTMFMSGIGANFEFDLKKIIAMSTLSQLGIMMTILMLGYSMLSFFHLIIHALFKATLFLCAGVLIHTLNNNQDIRMMGCMYNSMPMTMTMMNICNMSLCGMPFLSGFYSKDLIMEMMLMSNPNMVVVLLMYMGIGLTSFYSARMTYYSMNMNFNFYSFSCMSEKMNAMFVSIMTLTFYSILSGSMYSWMLFNSSTMILLPTHYKILTLIFSMIGLWMGYELSMNLNVKMNLKNEFLGSMWFMKQVSTFHNQLFMLKNSLMFQKSIDLGWGEFMGPQGMAKTINNLMKMNVEISKNNFKIHMISYLSWIIMILM